jgi:hypothetical protein
MTNKNEIQSILTHLYWFHNADMSDPETQEDFKTSLGRLTLLITTQNEE